jgi:E1A/CREB-binding protein
LENRVNNFLKNKDAGAGDVTIKVLSSGDKVVEVKPGMKTRSVLPVIILDVWIHQVEGFYSVQFADHYLSMKCNSKVTVRYYFRFCDNGEMQETFQYRAKAMFAFEEIDGTDVCFFGMHVQEYGSDCPQPNNRYKAYLFYIQDSVFIQEIVAS